MAQKKIQGSFRQGQSGSNELKFNKIVVLGDDAVDAFINESLLKSAGLNKEIVREDNPNSVIDQLKGAEKLQDIPELIFMDIRMESRDGFKFLDEFSKLPDFVKNKCKVVVISCSSQALSDRSRILLNPNVTHFLVKPLDAYQLKEIIFSHVEH